jgi:DNA primase
MCELEVGLDSNGRLTIPIRDADEKLHGVLRYQPWHTHQPKMLAVRGTQLGLIPNPARESSHQILLVEGPADMIAGRSNGMAAIAVPGTNAWRSEWRTLLAGRRVTVIMDCDRPGRDAAQRILRDLTGVADVSVLDLDPGRDDGYDLTDALLDRSHASVSPPALAWLRRDIALIYGRDERGIER